MVKTTILLPAAGEEGGRGSVGHYGAQIVVKAHFIIKIIEAGPEECFVSIWFVNLCNENQVRKCFLYLRNNPFPVRKGNHSCHIAAEAIDSFCRPEKQDVFHFLPDRGRRTSPFTSFRISAIVQLYGFVPICICGVGVEAIISCGKGWYFFIAKFCLFPCLLNAGIIGGGGEFQGLVRHIIKIVFRTECLCFVVLCAKAFFSLDFSTIHPCEVIRDMVDQYFQSNGTASLKECIKVAEGVIRMVDQVGADCIIVPNGIGGSCPAFDNFRRISGEIHF